MTYLAIYHDHDPATVLQSTQDDAQISSTLAQIGVAFSRWPTVALSNEATQDDILQHYAIPIAALKAAEGYQSADVIRVQPDHPQREQLRQKFLNEHTHSENEVRFFAEGSGTFYLHVDNKVYLLRSTEGDLISVPAQAKHWFDMGEAPFFTAIRLFTDPAGWAAQFTGNPIADGYPRHES